MNSIKSKNLYRIASINSERLASGDGDKKVYQASISSERVVNQFFGEERLEHSEEAVDLSRAAAGLPILIGHNRRDLPIGRAENVRLEGKRLVADLRFSDRDEIKELKRDIDDGIITDLSVGYRILDYKEQRRKDKPPLITVTRWRLDEVSLVGVPADVSVGVNRSNNEGGQAMPEDNVNTPDNSGQRNEGAVESGGNVVNFESGKTVGRQEGISDERKRVASIDALFAAQRMQTPEHQALKREAVTSGMSVAQVRERLVDQYIAAADNEPISDNRRDEQRSAGPGMFTAGRTQGEKLAEEMQFAIDFRCGLADGKREDIERQARQNAFTGLTLGEMARIFANEAGVRGVNMASLDRVIEAVFDPGVNLGFGRRDLMGSSTSDFPALLANTANKAIVTSYNEAPETWRAVARIGRVSDFKQNSRPSLSAFPGLDLIPEGGEYTHGKPSDLVEYLQAYKYGKKFSITREAIVNDDLNALSVIPAAMGRAAARTVADKVWSLYTSPPTLNQDSKAIFDATHKNTGTAGAPSVTTLSEARRLMRLQKDPSNKATLNLSSVLLIVPPIWETEAGILVTAQQLDYETSSGNAPKMAQNQFRQLSVVTESRLGGTAGTDDDWFVQASPTVHPFVEVDFVNGQETPYIASREGWDVDGVEYKVRLEFAYGALDFRPIVKNAGS